MRSTIEKPETHAGETTPVFDQLIRGLDRSSARAVLDSVSQFETVLPVDRLAAELAREREGDRAEQPRSGPSADAPPREAVEQAVVRGRRRRR